MTTKRFLILVVDDDKASLMLLGYILQGNGYDVITANNGPEARMLAKNEKPDLILMDVEMGAESGFDACIKLKNSPETSEIPIVFVSSRDDVDSIVEGLSIGGWDFISKPYHEAEVIARVRNYLKLTYFYKRLIEEQTERIRQIKQAQQAILIKPEDIPKAHFGVYYQPILEAGGDFYDVFEIADNIFGYFIADISGHDLGASFATSALKALIRQNSSQVYSPDETFRAINRILIAIFTLGQHLTATYCCLDRASNTLQIVNAAHLPVYKITEGKGEWMDIKGDVLGAFENVSFQNTQLSVSPGDRFFMFTDGLIENFEEPIMTRTQGFVKLEKLFENTMALPIEKAIESISVNMFSDGRKAEDDVMLMGFDI